MNRMFPSIQKEANKMCLIDFSELAHYHLEADVDWISRKIDAEHRKLANEEVAALTGIAISSIKPSSICRYHMEPAPTTRLGSTRQQ